MNLIDMNLKIDEFKAFQTSIKYRDQVELSWKASGYKKLVLYHSQYQSDGIDVTDRINYIFTNLIESIEFELQALNENGQIVSKKAFVKVITRPVINYFRSKYSIVWDEITCVHELEPFTLEWEVFNADKITLEPLDVENQKLQNKDSITIPPPKQDTIYKLKASNLFYDEEKYISIIVKKMPQFDKDSIPHFDALDSINYAELGDFFQKEKSEGLMKEIKRLPEFEFLTINDFFKGLKIYLNKIIYEYK